MSRPRIAVIDYGMGNLRSVAKALEKAGAQAIVTQSPRAVRSAEGVVLPGVGAFGEAANRLRSSGLDRAVESALEQGTPFLGICLGLQLLFERSEEDPRSRGLGFWKGRVVRFSSARSGSLKVPHMGWNRVRPAQGAQRPWVPDDYFYFVHSYFPIPEDPKVVAGLTPYGRTFCSAAAQGNVWATQFHPEKSGAAGARLLRAFLKKVTSC